METKKRILSFQGIRLFAFIVIFLSHSRLSSKVNGGGGGVMIVCGGGGVGKKIKPGWVFCDFGGGWGGVELEVGVFLLG